MTRLVAVSNRVALPGMAAAAGGLAIGLTATLRARGGLWFGWSGDVLDDHGDDRAPLQCARLHRDTGVDFVTLPLSRDEHRDFYQGFCNAQLWPLLHGFDPPAPMPSGEPLAYQRVNRRYARSLRSRLEPQDLIWVHDFHLIPMCRELRRLGVTQPVGFFLHVPFAAPAQWQQVPIADDLLDALLAYDVIGFQTARDLEHFRRAVSLGKRPAAFMPDGSVRLGERHIRLGVWPIGVDIDALRRAADRGDATTAPRPQIVGLDRLQASKGLEARLQAYSQLLDAAPALRGKIDCLQVVASARTDTAEQAGLRTRLRQLTDSLREKHGAVDWDPLLLLECTLEHDDALALLRRARIACVTPLRDGMNLVAKEFIAVQDPDDPGVLVLSRHAGAACELTAALRVDPADPRAIAAALHHALAMPRGERRARHAAMLAALRRHDLASWHGGFLAALAEHAAAQGNADCQSTMMLPPAVFPSAAPVSPGTRRSTRPIST